MTNNNKSQKAPEKTAIQKLLVIGALVFVQIPQVVSAWIDIAQWSLLLLDRDPATTRVMPEGGQPKQAPSRCRKLQTLWQQRDRQYNASIMRV